MIVTPYFLGTLSGTAHPYGCQRVVNDWIARARTAAVGTVSRRTLVVGCSGGLGLAARTAVSFGARSPSVGVAFERAGTPLRTGTSGWYRTVAFERAASAAGLSTRTLIGDAFADSVKQRVADVVASEFGALDLVVYSIATSRRRHPRTGIVHASAIKSIGSPFRAQGYDLRRGEVRPMKMPPATEQEVADTIAVMGGEDLRWWIDVLAQRELLDPGFRCLALSYIGVPELHATYRGGTLGAAKDDLERTVREMDADLRLRGLGTAATAVMHPLVTQASLAIPMNLLYTMLLQQVLGEIGIAEDVLDQGIRLIRAADSHDPRLDEHSRIRLDDAEQREDVQREVWSRWARVTTATVRTLAAVEAVERQWRQLYGFEVPGVDYAADVDLVAESDRIGFA